MKRITLKDIAKLANVSVTTVSLVLNDADSRISSAKKEEIKNIAKELNYNPNYLAKSLSTGSTKMVGLIIPDIENPYFSTFSKYIEDILRAKGYFVLLVNSNDKLDNDRKLINQLVDRRVDGLIIIPSIESYHKNNNQYIFKNINVPYVLVDRLFDEDAANQVSYDNKYGGYIATKFLLENGAINIACITGPLDSFSGKYRYQGYLKALSENKLAVFKENIYEGDYRFETGYEYGLKLSKRNDIDGIFSCNDLMAYGVLKAFRELRVKPEDFKIVGYDNLKQSEMFGISLTSVYQDINKLAEVSCKQLLAQIKYPKYKKSTVLRPKLIIK